MLLAFFFMFSACGSESREPLCERDPDACTPQGPAVQAMLGESCLQGASCPEDAICVTIDATTSTCLSTCLVPGDPCASGGVCVATRNAQPSICFVGEREAGEACMSEVECAQGLACAQGEGDALGMCTVTCDTPGGLCADGSLCLPGASQRSICLPGSEQGEGEPCEQSAACARGLRCLAASDEKLCVRACDTDAQCRDGMACEALMGDSPGSVCRPDVGAACISNSTCSAPTSCSTSFDDSFFFANLWPQGACAQAPCEPDACVAGSTCRSLGDVGTVCAPQCQSDADCRITQGWRCLDVSACEDGQPGCTAYFGDERLCHRPDRVWVLQ